MPPDICGSKQEHSISTLFHRVPAQTHQNIAKSILFGYIRDSIVYQLTLCRRCGIADEDGSYEKFTAN